MPDTVRELCLKKLFANLQTISGVANLLVERNRDTAIDRFPIINQADGGQESRYEFGLQITTLRVAIEIYVDANDPGALSTAFDTIYPKVALAVSSDTSLGGAAVDVRESGLSDPVPLLEDGQGPALLIICSVEIEFHTKPGDPYTLGP